MGIRKNQRLIAKEKRLYKRAIKEALFNIMSDYSYEEILGPHILDVLGNNASEEDDALSIKLRKQWNEGNGNSFDVVNEFIHSMVKIK